MVNRITSVRETHYSPIVSRLDSAEQEIVEALSAHSGIGMAQIEDLMLRLMALSEHDLRQINSSLRRVFGKNEKEHLALYLGAINPYSMIILTTIIALCQASATASLVNPRFPSATVTMGNWMTTRGIQLVTLGKYAGRAFLQLPAVETAGDIFHKALSGGAQALEAFSTLPRNSNEAYKVLHQSEKDSLAQHKQNISSDIDRLTGSRDQFFNLLRQKRQELHDLVISLFRS